MNKPSQSTIPLTAEAVRKEAFNLGFDAVGFVRVDDEALKPLAPALDRFLNAGYHADMDWLAANRDRRSHPSQLWPDAKSVIALAVNYGPDHDPMAVLAQPDKGAISVYAQAADYHDIIKKRLKRLARWMVEQSGDEADVKVFVDTAPVMEKPLAERAGLGWRGKHTNLVSRQFGSWLFLGEIFTTLELAASPPEVDHCGSCDACMRVCPTDAFPEAYQLDAGRCISYLTIEHKGDIAPELMAKMGNHIYGCDDCLAACPWTKFTQVGFEEKLIGKPENRAPDLVELSQLDDAAFRERFRGSPIKRTGRERFIRNIIIAMGNARSDAFEPDFQRLSEDESELVRHAANWALEQLSQSDK